MADRAAVSLDQTASAHPPLLGNNDNAIRLQIFAAMIAYALLRIAAAGTASRSRSCALPIWSPCACSNAATSPPSKSPRPSTQVAHNVKTPKIS